MKYVICSIENAKSKGIVINDGHPKNGKDVCLTSSDVIFCSSLDGEFDERVKVLNGTVYDSAKMVNEIIKNWCNDNDKQETED